MNSAELTKLLQQGLDSWDQGGRRSQGGLLNLNLTQWIESLITSVREPYEEQLKAQEKRIAELEERMEALK